MAKPVKQYTRNFHVPLSEDIYESLHGQSKILKRPATTLARHAIETWVELMKREQVEKEIKTFAKQNC